MYSRTSLLAISVLLLVSCSPESEHGDATQSAGDPGADKPNILIMLADDLGWTDVSLHGGNIATPNIDSIAVLGAELARYYVAPVCSPTRAGLLTGRYPIRFGSMRAVYPPWRQGGMDLSETTLPEMLAAAGYKHRGIFGKWHLGHSHKKYHPLNRGFTEFYGHYNGAIDYFTHEREGELDWHSGFEASLDQGYTTDLIADAAVRFIDHHAGDDEPFLCYVPFNAPHSPFQAKDSDLMLYKQLPPARGSFQGATGEDSTRVREQRNSNRRVLGAMVHSLDQAVGRIVDAIERNGILENTFILFSSDNGGVRGIGENTPLCGAKATVFEGGIRVPTAVRWHGMIPGGRKINEPLANIDVFPTVMRLAGVEQSVGKPLDGVDMLDILTGKQEKLERELFNYIGQSGLLGEQISYMTNDWKMIVIGPVVTDENADDADRQKFLFNISKDISEENNLVDQNPARAATMYKKIKWFRSLQPEEAVPPYNEGRDSKSFKAPHQWEMSDD